MLVKLIVLRPRRISMRVPQVQAPVKLVPMQRMPVPVPVMPRVNRPQLISMQAPLPQLLLSIQRIAGSSRMRMRPRVLLLKQIAMQAWLIVLLRLDQLLPVMPVTKRRQLPVLIQMQVLLQVLQTVLPVLRAAHPRLVTVRLPLVTLLLPVRLQTLPRVLSPLPVLPRAKQLPMIH